MISQLGCLQMDKSVNKDRTELTIGADVFPIKKRIDGFSETVLIGGIWMSIENVFDIGFNLEEAKKLKLDVDILDKECYSSKTMTEVT